MTEDRSNKRGIVRWAGLDSREMTVVWLDKKLSPEGIDRVLGTWNWFCSQKKTDEEAIQEAVDSGFKDYGV